MKRILINATHSEEVRVALCKGNHLYDFDLENRTREQKKANIYKGHITRVEPSLEAVFVEYGSKRQGFLPIREIASNYLSGNPREENIRKLIKEGDELIVQVEKEERGNKGAALSTYVSLAGRYLVLMPNNPKGGGISRQISGKLREDMKRMLGNMDLPKGMSVIIRTAGIGKTQEDLQHDLNHLLSIWNAIQDQNKKYPSPRLVHQEAGVVTRAVRDYLRDDISEIWIDNEDAFIEAENFVKAVMPKQLGKLRKYTEYEPMFASFGVERQIETAYLREVRLPSGGSIVIDQTEALVSIDINSAKSTKGADVSETAYHTNLEAADEIARQLRLRDMGGLVVIDFIDMNDNKHQKAVEKRLVDATKYDRARVQFGDISRFGLLEMSRQRLRPSLEEATGYVCPRCHGTGMIRDLRSLSLSIMRQIEQTALKERHGEVQAEVPTDIAAFLLNEKRESLVYLEQDSGCRITILPHAHLESPNFNLHFNHQGFAPSSYERVTDTQEQETSDRGYEVNWQTAENQRPDDQPTRQPRQNEQTDKPSNEQSNRKQDSHDHKRNSKTERHVNSSNDVTTPLTPNATQAQFNTQKPAAVAWLSNLFAETPQANLSASVSSADAASAIEAIVNTGAQSRGAFGVVDASIAPSTSTQDDNRADDNTLDTSSNVRPQQKDDSDDNDADKKDSNRSRRRNTRGSSRYNKNRNHDSKNRNRHSNKEEQDDNRSKDSRNDDSENNQSKNGQSNEQTDHSSANQQSTDKKTLPKREPNSKRKSRGAINRGKAKSSDASNRDAPKPSQQDSHADKSQSDTANKRHDKSKSDPNEVNLQVNQAESTLKPTEVVHINLDDSKESDQKAESSTKELFPKELSPKDGQDVGLTESDSTDTKPTTSAISIDAKSAGDEDNTASTPSQKRAQDESSSDKQVAVENSAENPEPEVRPGFDRSTLFASRYITAKKYGQAPNDPRLVKASMTQMLDSDAENKTGSVISPELTQSSVAIRGNVGEFIHTHLANASLRLEKDGVIRCFIAALSAHKQTSGMEPVTDLTIAAVIPEPVFNFINYGYEPLSHRYLDKFHTMTSAVAQTTTPQGKTDVEEPSVGRRAANDPRGQHPDYQAPESKAKEDVSASVTEDDVNTQSVEDTSTADKSPVEAMAELLALNVGEFVCRVLGQDGIDMLAKGQTEAAFLQALRQPFDVLMSVAQEVDGSESECTETTSAKSSAKETITSEITNVEPVSTESESTDNSIDAVDEDNSASVLANPDDVETVEQRSESVLEENNDNVDNRNDSEGSSIENSANDDDLSSDEQAVAKTDASDGTSNKTSIESYKSMIENISEQLLPQTGILNLTAPKVPKARSRKVKDDSAKSSENDS